MTVCAYCQQDRSTTREHVIPAFIYAFQKQLGQSVIGWNEVANRMVGGEGKVKDVCAECNSGALAQLDSYGKQLLTDSGLLVPNYSKASLTLRYDYSLLLRWLLKISFNSSRMDGIHAPVFNEHIPFMLGAAPPPPRYKVAAFLYLARSELMEPPMTDWQALVDIAQGAKRLNPFLVRICYGAMRGNHSCIHRINIFGPAVFNLLLFPDHILPGHAASEARSFLKSLPQAVVLSPSRRLVQVSAGQQSWLDLHGAQAMRVHGQIQFQK